MMMTILVLFSCWPGGLSQLAPEGQGGPGGGDLGDLPPGGSDDGAATDSGSGTDGGDGGDGGEDSGGTTSPIEPESLSAARELARVSIALRGTLPTVADFQLVEKDASQLGSLVDSYLYDPAFLETVKDAYAERLLTRQDLNTQFGNDDMMAMYTATEAFTMMESPLQLIAHVIDDDRPFTDIVTTNDVWVNEPMSDAFGPVWHPGGDEWQLVQGWGDDRPPAGLLGNSLLWVRHQSMGSNYQRGRANVIADSLLCESFTDRDVDIDGTIDLSSEEAILDAVNSNPNCLACHQALEPLAANFWGFQNNRNPWDIDAAYASGCTTNPENCYPLTEYDSEQTDSWEHRELRAPGYYGTPVSDLSDLGKQIASDPRFSQCVVRTVYGYLAQVDRSEVPLETVATYQKLFEANGYNVRALAKAIVLSPAFLLDGTGDDGTVGMLNMRPEAVGRTVETLTGFVWRASDDLNACTGLGCYGVADLMNNDTLGFRAMSGGVDGLYVTIPVWDSTPTRVMAIDSLMSEAAAYVVAKDLAEPELDQRQLLTALADPMDLQQARSQIAALSLRLYGDAVSADDASLDPANLLFEDALARHGNATEAWTLVVAAMLQDPALLFY